MNSVIHIALTPTADQHARLVALQQAFAQVCNALIPLVQQTRVWNRVALHHLAYRSMRQQFPEIGSQMVCNAIYSVSRACRLVFQTPSSPFHISRMQSQELPRLHFTENCPVYFDRHTLSLKKGQVSMYTLDGRMRFELAVTDELAHAFQEERLIELSLSRPQDSFVLSFRFQAAPDAPASMALPNYLSVETNA